MRRSEADREWCKATTMAGDPCRSIASIDGLCATHYRQARRSEERASAELEASQDTILCGGTNVDGRPCRNPREHRAARLPLGLPLAV